MSTTMKVLQVVCLLCFASLIAANNVAKTAENKPIDLRVKKEAFDCSTFDFKKMSQECCRIPPSYSTFGDLKGQCKYPKEMDVHLLEKYRLNEFQHENKAVSFSDQDTVNALGPYICHIECTLRGQRITLPDNRVLWGHADIAANYMPQPNNWPKLTKEALKKCKNPINNYPNTKVKVENKECFVKPFMLSQCLMKELIM
ncbi:hypothetical protein B566_EDAN004815, partial [Ephemera danica]